MAELPEEQKRAIEDYLSKEETLTKAQRKAIEDYLSKRTELNQAEKTRVNSYLQNVVVRVLSILGITTILGLIGAWTGIINTVVKQAQAITDETKKKITDEIDDTLKRRSSTLEDFFITVGEQNNQLEIRVNTLNEGISKAESDLNEKITKANNQLETQINTLNNSLSKAQADIATAQQKIDAALNGDVAKLGETVQGLENDVKGIQDALALLTPEDRTAIENLQQFGVDIKGKVETVQAKNTELETQIEALDTRITPLETSR
jgi:chaperonin cofactor prefoldin